MLVLVVMLCPTGTEIRTALVVGLPGRSRVPPKIAVVDRDGLALVCTPGVWGISPPILRCTPATSEFCVSHFPPVVGPPPPLPRPRPLPPPSPLPLPPELLRVGLRDERRLS